MSGATVDLGNIKFNWKGPWANSTAYVVNDTVFSSPHGYVCITANTSHASDPLLATSDSAYWNQMTAGSTTGLPTQTGQAGEFLQTDGTNASWEPVTPPTATAVSDQANTSTGYFDVPAGTTAQRPGSPATGNMRWNTDDEALEHYSGSAGGWVQWAMVEPTITSISPTTAHTTGTTITVTGINFQSGSVVKLIGSDSTIYNAVSTTFVSATEVTFTTPELPVANEPYDVKLILPSGGFFVLENVLDAGGVAAWTTASGLLGTIFHNAPGTHFTLVAVDPDSQAVTYSMDTANTAILTSAGLTLNTTTGAITGDPTDQASGTSTTYTFDVTATDGVNSTTRSFSITVQYEFFEGASGGTVTTYSSGGINYRVHTFTTAGTTQTFNSGIGGTVDMIAVAGGGGGGRVHSDQDTSQGGGGAGCVGVATTLVLAASTAYSLDIGRGAYHDQTDRYWKNYMSSYTDTDRCGISGEDTVITGIITLPGGGGGGRSDGGGGTPPAGNNGRGGGSGGGAGSRSGPANGGSSTKPTVGGWTTYGNNGGSANTGQTENGGGGGGGAGGVGAAGAAGNTNNNLGLGGDGGDGIENDFQTGVNQYYGGGGGGGTCHAGGYQASGGLGGGGKGNCQVNGSPNPAWTTEMAGTENTGSGGGGSSDPVPGTQDGAWAGGGGSGIVIIRYVV